MTRAIVALGFFLLGACSSHDGAPQPPHAPAPATPVARGPKRDLSWLPTKSSHTPAPTPTPTPTPAPTPSAEAPTNREQPVIAADDSIGRTRPAPATGVRHPPAVATPVAPSNTPVACGEDGQPRCPLQAWMEDNFNAAVEAGDTAAVARAYTRVATMAPAPAWNQGTPSWRAMAESGAASATAGNLREARTQCRACHQAFRTRYRAEFRLRPVPQ